MSFLQLTHPDCVDSVCCLQLARAVDTEDYATIQNMMRLVNRHRMEQEEALRKEQELLEADPMNPETQRRIEELIHNKNIEENYLHAMEHTPEVFTRVEMLYVNMEINGVPVKAFVDSGAQMSIMTQAVAEKEVHKPFAPGGGQPLEHQGVCPSSEASRGLGTAHNSHNCNQ
ncbi:aspartyl protease-domain-containing protein [Dunaliella salina]|uniref:Aspartyl protease-domain-containing protein n=1 Tax=Dunaliella salina TaxID=3046 RepID=A0ABQ7G116_DUNSA|nr:aspartyl protease-domain-containing protein [Dunaliella salina]|eukprot:KAF5828298.1 aspartyl protease-domain-containing protein [Dunaliella salina]